jgi:hypothetical protein
MVGYDFARRGPLSGWFQFSCRSASHCLSRVDYGEALIVCLIGFCST